MQAFGHLLAVAETVNTGLHPRVAGELWQRLGESPCARALPAGDRVWLELFAAVGARDAARMSDAAGRALESQRNAKGPATEYAFMAAVTAAVRQGDRARAMALLEEGQRSWLRAGSRRVELAYLYNLTAAMR